MGSPFVNLNRQFNDATLSDMIVKVGTEKFFVSKVILALWSQPLATCISNAARPNFQIFQLRLCNVDVEIVDLMLKFFYSGNEQELYNKLSPLVAWKLLLLSDLLCVDTLLNLCQRYLKDWLLRYEDVSESFPSDGEVLEEPNKSETLLRLMIIVTCLRCDSCSPAFSLLRDSVLHLLVNTPNPIRRKQSTECHEISPSRTDLGDAANNSSHSTSDEKKGELPGNNDTLRYLNPSLEPEQRCIPSFILRLQLMDLCSLLSSDTVQMDENTLLQWTLSYSAYYANHLTKKFIDEMKKKNHPKEVDPPSAVPSLLKCLSPDKTKKNPCPLSISENSNVIPCPPSKMRRFDHESQENDLLNDRPISDSSLDPLILDEVILDCSPIVNSSYDCREELVPQNILDLSFIELCSYFQLQASVTRQLLKKILLHKIKPQQGNKLAVSTGSQPLPGNDTKTTESHHQVTLGDRLETKNSTPVMSSDSDVHILNERRNFLTFFFEGYIYASLEPYLRYSLLQPVYLKHLRDSPFFCKQLVIDAAFLQLSEKPNKTLFTVPPQNNKSLNQVESPNDEFERQGSESFFSKGQICPSPLRPLPSFLINDFQNRIVNCVRKQKFFLLPSLLSQYGCLSHRLPPFKHPTLRKQITTPRSILPFKWFLDNSSSLVLSGHLMETVTVLSASSGSSQWSRVYADAGPRSGLHHWMIRINRSSLNNIVIGVMEYKTLENNTGCQCCFTSQGASRSLVLYSQKLYAKSPRTTMNSKVSNTPQAYHVSSSSQHCTGWAGHLSAGFPVVSMQSQTLSKFQPMRNDIIVARLDLRSDPGKLRFYCVRPKSRFANEESSHTPTPGLTDMKYQSFSVWLIATVDDIETVLPPGLEWRLFVNLHDKGDSITLLPYENEIVNGLSDIVFTC